MTKGFGSWVDDPSTWCSTDIRHDEELLLEVRVQGTTYSCLSVVFVIMGEGVRLLV